MPPRTSAMLIRLSEKEKRRLVELSELKGVAQVDVLRMLLNAEYDALIYVSTPKLAAG